MKTARSGLLLLMLGAALTLSLGAGCSGSGRFPVISTGEMVDIDDHLEDGEWTLVYFTADW